MSPEPLVNTAKYTTPELVFFAAGGLAWALAYMGVLRQIVRQRFVEIPATAVAGNIAWEFTWGLVYRTDLGLVFVWGYRLWFLLDVFIVWGLLRYGVRHLGTAKLREYFRFAFEPGQAGAVQRPSEGQDLYRDVAFETRIPGAVDLTHAAGADRREDFDLAEAGSCRQAHDGPMTAGYSRERSGGRQQQTAERVSRG